MESYEIDPKLVALFPSMYNEGSARAKVLRYLAEKGPSNPYAIWRDEKNRSDDDRIRRYATINETVRELEKRGYLKFIHRERGKRGGERLIYGLNGFDGFFAAIAYCGVGLDVGKMVDNYRGSIEADDELQEAANLLVICWAVQGFSNQLVTLMRYSLLQPVSKGRETILRAILVGATKYPKDPKLIQAVKKSKAVADLRPHILKAVKEQRKALDAVESAFKKDA